MSHRSNRLALLVAAAGLVLSGCGAEEPEPLKPLDPVIPQDLCASIPDELRAGLDTSSTSDESGDPVATCSLRSRPGASGDVRGLVALVQLNDEDSADTSYGSQCRALDPAEYAVRDGFALEGADEVCAGQGKQGDSAQIAAVAGRAVITVRFTADPPAKPDALSRARSMGEAVLKDVAGSTASPTG